MRLHVSTMILQHLATCMVEVLPCADAAKIWMSYFRRWQRIVCVRDVGNQADALPRSMAGSSVPCDVTDRYGNPIRVEHPIPKRVHHGGRVMREFESSFPALLKHL